MKSTTLDREAVVSHARFPNRASSQPSATERMAMTKIFDAWIVGQHELPADAPHRVMGSAVVVHDRDTDQWTGMSLDQFEDQFEWLPEPPEPLISVGDLGVF
jgi:hypothetical protein